MVTGGFTRRGSGSSRLVVPADVYGVGSGSSRPVTHQQRFTADVVRVKIEGKWYDLAKTGRKACENLMLERVR